MSNHFHDHHAMPSAPFCWEDTSLILKLYVQPKASRTDWSGLHENQIKLKVAAPPVEDQANRALQAFVAKQCKVAKSQVTLVKGHNSRHKTVEIQACDPALWVSLFQQIQSQT